MRFRFNERKASQAAAFLIERHGGGRLNYLKLIKLLYLADRRVLVERGRTITGDRMVSMDHGPVLSGVYACISEGPEPGGSPWFEYVSAPERYEVALVEAQPDRDELSRYEIRILEAIDDEFGVLDTWVLRDLTHELPEWVDPHGTSLLIRPETILSHAGAPEHEIQRVVDDAEDVFFLEAHGA